MTQLSGTITLIEGEGVEQCKTKHAVVRDSGDIAFDFDYGLPGSPYIYTVVLSRIDVDLLEGQFSGGSCDDSVSGKVTCRQYTGARGIALTGLWFESGHRYEWFAELQLEQA